MRAMAAVAATLFATACGPHDGVGGPAPPAVLKGTVAGQVLGYPCAPVERLGSPCAGRPEPGVTVTLTPSQGEAATVVVTDASGNYSVRVPAGSYLVTVKGKPFGGASRRVQVAANATVTADFVIDSGIR